jgi:ATP-dependent protease ClpP protease subunit
MNDKDNEISFESYAHFLSGNIDPTIIEAASRWILYAKFNKIEKPLTLHINSEGGNLGDAIGVLHS